MCEKALDHSATANTEADTTMLLFRINLSISDSTTDLCLTISSWSQKTRWGVKKKTRGDQKNKVGGLKNKGPVYFDKISCTCAAQHYLYNNRAKLLVSTENLVKVFKHSCW